MSQEQPRGPQGTPGPIKYSDIFDVSVELADKPVAPRDAAMMRSAETTAFGQTQPGGPAEVMQTAARVNERAGLVGRGDVNDIARDRGVTIAGTEVPGGRIITEKLGEQVLGQYVQVAGVQQTTASGVIQRKITIGQAVEATIQTAGDKPVDQADAAAIKEAEMRATGSGSVIPGGFAASAQSAAAYNAGVIRDEDKIKLRAVVAGASGRLPAMEVTREDADRVVNAEQSYNPRYTTYPGGIAASISTAARLNEEA